jgi:hypothetical protein
MCVAKVRERQKRGRGRKASRKSKGTRREPTQQHTPTHKTAEAGKAALEHTLTETEKSNNHTPQKPDLLQYKELMRELHMHFSPPLQMPKFACTDQICVMSQQAMRRCDSLHPLNDHCTRKTYLTGTACSGAKLASTP